MGEWINKNKKIVLTIFLMLIIIISGTVAWLTWKSKESSLVLTVGEVNGPSISLYPYQLNGTLSPVLNYEGVNYVQVEATNNKNGGTKAKLFYNVKSIDNALISGDVKYTVTSSDSKNGTYTEYVTGDLSSASAGNVLEIANIDIPANSNKFYRVYLWIDGNSSNSPNMQNKTLSLELRAEFVDAIYSETILNGAIPELDDGMIPVTISDTGVVTTISKSDSNWYNYENKQWANVVLTTSSSRSKYFNTTGVPVSESDILAYLVWIPRYKYKIWTTTTSSKGNEQTIEVIFEDKTTQKSNGTTVGSYLTHPAFTFGDVELNGIWVGKFETTGDVTTPTVKPNLQSLRSQNVSTQFVTAQKFGTIAYGSSVQIDAHMMKNSEWGAVVYLSHSKYGVNREIYINNSSGFYTGRSGGNVGGSTAIKTVYTDQTSNTTYNTYGFYTWDGYLLNYDTNTKSSTHDISKVASTTGNITGIYDMSGGAYEYVMGVFANSSGSLWSGYNSSLNSGFTGLLGDSSDSYTGMPFPDSKYYDVYKATSGTTISTLTACDGGICYGHALSETANWYSDYAIFLISFFPWLERGAHYSDEAGAGAFYSANGDGGDDFNLNSFRLVLVKVGDSLQIE